MRLSAGFLVLGLTFWVLLPVRAAEMELVRDGKAVATIIVGQVGPDAGGEVSPGDREAANVLVSWIKKITDVELPVAESATASGPAIYVGAAAKAAGLNLEDIESPSHEGLRIVCDGKRILLGGQDAVSTTKAACRLLEELGCRYLMDLPMGEVFPRSRTLTIRELNISEKPGLMMRRMWGSCWFGQDLWKIWNGSGGLPMNAGHSWANYVGSNLFREHPEWFALIGTMRQNNNWLCTSNPELRKYFTARVLAVIEAGNSAPSISPPDGRGHCQCPNCTALDDPHSLEVGGVVSKSNRYTDFYRAINDEVSRKFPNAILNFYAYADYTLSPTSGQPLPKNLAAWVAPISYCWFHGMGNPNCRSRQKVKAVYDQWTSHVAKFGYRDYTYNIGDCILPFSKLDACRHDMPFLKKIGCIGVDMETIPCWMSYGPHMYLYLRLAYDPDADSEALLKDYFLMFYGPKAGPLVQDYYMRIDKAITGIHCDNEKGSRGLDDLAQIYTPSFLAELQGLLDRAAVVADTDACKARVALTQEGLKNAQDYRQILQAIEAKDFLRAKRVYESLLSRNKLLLASRQTNHYTIEYLQRFLAKGKDLIHLAAISPPNKVLVEFPDLWRNAWDKDGRGLDLGFSKSDFDDSAWELISTYKEKMTSSSDVASTRAWKYRWFRTTFEVPGEHGKLQMYFNTLEPEATVYINGKLANDPKNRPEGQWGVTFVCDVTGAISSGTNVIAIRRPNAWGRLVEQPVLLIESNADGAQAPVTPDATGPQRLSAPPPPGLKAGVPLRCL